MKKQHACGCKEFEIIRTGMDVKIKCTKCSRLIMLDRDLRKESKKLIKSDKNLTLKNVKYRILISKILV
ncbi:DUF951 family protein [Clostridioides difficile]|nr:DUF951 family protein [Clostridioides difficile]